MGTFFCFAKQLEPLFSYFLIFQFRKTIETLRNSDLFRTVLFFAKLKKYETVNSSGTALGLARMVWWYRGKICENDGVVPRYDF